MPQLQLHDRSIGAPTGEPVLVLHGTPSSSTSMLTPAFAGELFGAGQPLDASLLRHPSRRAWPWRVVQAVGRLAHEVPQVQLRGLVDAHYRVLTEHLNVRHLDYNPSAGLEKITATVLAINAADDERNPPELGLLDREIKRVKNGRVLLIPARDSTTGHGTTGMAKFYQRELGELLQSAPRVGQ